MATKAKRGTRPRLELSQQHKIYAGVNRKGDHEQARDAVYIGNEYGHAIYCNGLASAKRLHRFLGRAIAYLEGRKK